MKYIANYKIFENNSYNFKYISPQWGDFEESEKAQEFLNKNFKSYDMNDPLNDSNCYIIYYVDSKIVAACEFSLFSTENWEIDEDYLNINYIYTDTKRQGICYAMVKDIIESYKSISKLFTSYVRKSNKESLFLFQKLGFKIVRESDDVIGVDETSYELHLHLPNLFNGIHGRIFNTVWKE